MSPKPAPRLAKRDLDLVLSLTRELWEEASAQSIFITGGTGFFGCWLVESFCHINRELGLGARATVLTRDPKKFAAKCPHLAGDSAVTLLAGDVRDFEFPQGEFRYVLHAATEAVVQPTREDTLATTIDGTQHAIEFAKRCGARRFLLTSSGAVYGPQPAEMTHVPETYTPDPAAVDAVNAYSEGKRRSELLCGEMTRGTEIEAAIARCWAFCGPHLALDAHFAIGNFIGNVITSRPIVIGGDGMPRRSYLYAADLAVWLWTMLFRAPALVPINVGSGNDISIRELAETVARVLAPETEIRIAKQPVPDAPPARYVPNVDRARDLLGLRQTVALEEQIRRTAEWHGFTSSAQ